MKENFKMDLEKDINSNKLLVEVIRKTIEDGGDNKLKNCVEKYFDNKKINLDEIKTENEKPTKKEEEIKDDKESKAYDTLVKNIATGLKTDEQKPIMKFYNIL